MVVRPLTPRRRGVAFFTLDRRCALSLEKGVSVRAADMVVHDDDAIFSLVVVVDCVCGGLCESAVSLQMVKVFDKSDVDCAGRLLGLLI